MRKIPNLLFLLVLVFSINVKAQERPVNQSFLEDPGSTTKPIERKSIEPVFVQEQSYQEKKAPIDESEFSIERASAEQRSRRRGVLLLASIVVIVILLV